MANNAFGLVSIISTIILGLLSFILGITMIYKIYCTKLKSNVAKPLLYVCIVHFIFYGIANTLIDPIVNITWNDIHIHTKISLSIITAVLYMTVFATVYIFFMMHTFYTLHGTIFEVSFNIFYIHSFLLFLVIIFYILAFINIIWLYLSIAMLQIGCTHIVYIFTARLFQVVLSQRQSIGYYYNSKKNQDNQQEIKKQKCAVNDRQMKILAVITKISVIMISLLILVTLFFIVEIIWIGSGQNDQTLQGMIKSILIKMLSGCMELCIFITFGMNKNLYDIICNKCHYKLNNFCEIIAINSIEKQRRRSLKHHVERQMEAHSKNMQISQPTLRMPSTTETRQEMDPVVPHRISTTVPSQSQISSVATTINESELEYTPRSSIPFARIPSVTSQKSTTFSIVPSLNQMPSLPELHTTELHSTHSNELQSIPSPLLRNDVTEEQIQDVSSPQA